MSYSTLAHAMISYVECHLEHFSLTEMSKCFGFSEIYLRELFLKNINMPIMQYYRRRLMINSAFELLYSDKTIMDIALESGFSNHESYTRAFRKVFDMSPSQFRRSRPLIGGTQLDAGVFGLERLTEKRKRSDKFMTTHCGSNTILYGIREIKFGSYESNTMFPICIKAVIEYLGDDVSFADIMAATGAAFRLTWNQREWDLSNIDIYHTLKESNEIYGYGAKSLGIIGPPEPCIITGYDTAQDAVMGWISFSMTLNLHPQSALWKTVISAVPTGGKIRIPRLSCVSVLWRILPVATGKSSKFRQQTCQRKTRRIDRERQTGGHTGI